MEKTRIILALFLFTLASRAFSQEFQASAELQSSFIDITGLFGVKEPASVIQFNYEHNGFGVNVYHSASLEEFGNAIQTLVTPYYKTKLDKAGKWTLRPKAEIFYNRPSGGSFVRPGFHIVWQPNKHHTLNLGNWLFLDLREKTEFPTRLNGSTNFFSYTHRSEVGKWQLTQESRLLFVHIADVVDIAGAFQALQFTYQPLKAYIGVNGVYSFYRSDGKNDFLWNIIIGKYF